MVQENAYSKNGKYVGGYAILFRKGWLIMTVKGKRIGSEVVSAVIRLFFDEQMSMATIARTLKIDPRTVAKVVRREKVRRGEAVDAEVHVKADGSEYDLPQAGRDFDRDAEMFLGLDICALKMDQMKRDLRAGEHVKGLEIKAVLDTMLSILKSGSEPGSKHVDIYKQLEARANMPIEGDPEVLGASGDMGGENLEDAEQTVEERAAELLEEAAELGAKLEEEGGEESETG